MPQTGRTMLTPGSRRSARGRECLRTRFADTRRESRRRARRREGTLALADSRPFRQRPIAIRTLPTWLAVATMLKAPAVQIAMLMRVVCHGRRDMHVTSANDGVTAWQQRSVTCDTLIREDRGIVTE